MSTYEDPEFVAWMAEVNAEGVRRGLARFPVGPKNFFRLSSLFSVWANGASPAEAVETRPQPKTQFDVYDPDVPF